MIKSTENLTGNHTDDRILSTKVYNIPGKSDNTLYITIDIN